MTTNQLIALLSIYRGTEPVDNHPATHKEDLDHLKAEGFIWDATRPEDAVYVVTPLAASWIREILTIDK